MTGLIVGNVSYLDPVSGDLIPGTWVRIDGDRIAAIGDHPIADGPDDAVVIDGGGRIMLPGLIDAHVHAAFTTGDLPAMLSRAPSRIGVEAKAILERMLLRGFTTVRDAGGMDSGIAECVALGLIDGPRVFRAGRMISQTGGHGDISPSDPNAELCACAITSTFLGLVADGPDAVRRAAREELKNGADHIKVIAGGGVASPTDPITMIQYTEDEIRAAVVEATNRNTYAMAHAYTPDAIAQAVRAGVRSIEHGNLLDEATAQLMARQGVYLVPTLVVGEELANSEAGQNLSPASKVKMDLARAAANAAIEIAIEAGVKLGFGTDLFGEMQDAQSEEFALRAALQPAIDVIRSATIVNAEILCRSDDLGQLKPGAFADLLLVDADPLTDISVLGGQGEHLDLIVRAGKIIKNRL